MRFVTIVTVNFKQNEVTKEFLTSISAYSGKNALEVILVDNGCMAPAESYFKEIYPELIYLPSRSNLGFAGGNNLGISRAKGEYLLLLNNDTELTEGFIDQMVEEMDRNPSIGILSPLILYHENPTIIQYAGYSDMNYYTVRNRTIGQFEKNENQYKEISRETGFCHGAAMMCRRKEVMQVGGMDENYFLYYEELDWCEKFRRAGLKIWFTGKATIYHKESMSVGKESALKIYFVTRNRMLFIRKNGKRKHRLVFFLYYTLLFAPVKSLQFLFSSKSHFLPWMFRGIAWNFTEKTNSTHLGYPIE